MYDSVKPDIVFESIRKKKIAIEVETGGTIDMHKDRIVKKVEELKKAYSEWFFVVSESANAYKYNQFGQTFTRKNVCRKLRSYFKKWKQKIQKASYSDR